MTLGDRAYGRRQTTAFAIALGLAALAAALLPTTTPAPPADRTVTQVVTVARRTPPPTPAPTPPTPTPTPHMTAPPRPTLAPRVVVRNPAPKAAATPQRRLGGAAAAKHLAILRSRPAAHAAPHSLAEGTHAGQQNGGTGTGAGPGAGDGGLGGTGSGTGGSGNGNGGTTNAGPCGAVYLLPGQLSFRRDGTVEQHVIAKIVFGDGRVELAPFPYPFTYAGEKLNPFQHDIATPAGGTIPIQLPPDGTDTSTYPKAVQLVLQYTNLKTGTTLLPDCGSPLPSTAQN